jgi:hypothetical protein
MGWLSPLVLDGKPDKKSGRTSPLPGPFFNIFFGSSRCEYSRPPTRLIKKVGKMKNTLLLILTVLFVALMLSGCYYNPYYSPDYGPDYSPGYGSDYGTDYGPYYSPNYYPYRGGYRYHRYPYRGGYRYYR